MFQINGIVEGKLVSWILDVDFFIEEFVYDMLVKIWVRKKIEQLMYQLYYVGLFVIEEEVIVFVLNY